MDNTTDKCFSPLEIDNCDIIKVGYNTCSNEDLLCKCLAELDNTPVSYGNSGTDTFNIILKKMLYNFETIEGTKYNTIKNKYYYFNTEGTINYLQAIHRIRDYYKDDKDKPKMLSYAEKKNIYDHIRSYEKIRIISLGCGDGETDIKLLRKLGKNKNIEYIPIDISSHLLNITINKYLKLIGRINVKDKWKIKPILSDFWKLDNVLINYIPINDDYQNIFLLLGQTLANYKEKALLDKITGFMPAGSSLFCGVKLKNERISEDYLNPENIQFVISPLKLIPKFRGYLTELSKYLVYDKAILPDFSDIDECETFAPYLYLRHKDRGNDKIHLAYSTKYNINKLRDWLEFNYGSKNVNNKFEPVIDNNPDRDSNFVFRIKKASL